MHVMSHYTAIRLSRLGFALEWSIDYWSDKLDSTLKHSPKGYTLSKYLTDIVKDVCTMAKVKPNGSTGVVTARPNNTNWVNINLSADDIQRIVEWEATGNDLLAGIVNLNLSGYTLTVKPDPKTDGFLALLFSPSNGNESGNYGLSAFARNPYDALKVLLYKFEHIMGGEFADVSQASGGDFR